MPILEVVDINKFYLPDTHAVRDADIRLERGKSFACWGLPAAAKRPCGQIIAGLERPDSGAILFEGRDIINVPPHERGFGMMFQDFALFPHKNVRDNIAFGLRMKKLPPKEIAERVARILDIVELDGLADRTISRTLGRRTATCGVGASACTWPASADAR